VAIPGYIVAVLVAYLLGSIPTGFLLGKARGIDVRTVGSGNIGATNVSRALGRPAGAFVLLADVLKGWLAVAVVAKLAADWLHLAPGPQTQDLTVCAGLAAILGHNYTCWLHFKGGKGIATSAGVLLALVPWSLLIILGVWIIVFALTRYVSLASICASVALPFAVAVTNEAKSKTMIVVAAAMAGLAIYKHRANIRRLLNGTETRFGGRKSETAQAPHQAG